MASNTKKAIKGMSSQALVTIVLGVLEIVSFSIMSRLLSKEDFGYYAAIAAIVAVFESFAETGIGSAIVQRKSIDSKYVNNAFTLSLIFGIGISLILFLSSSFLATAVIDESMRTPIKVMSITLLFHCLTSVNISILQRELKFLLIGAIQLVSLVVTTVVAIILALKGYGFYAIIAKVVLASVITLVLSYYFSHTKYRIELNKSTFKDIFSFSGWLMASRFFSNLSKQIDRLVMPKMLSVAILGAYTRPKEFVTQNSGKINSIFDKALFPILSSIQDKKESLQRAYSKALYLLNLSTSVLTLYFIVNSKLILRIFFGEQWLYLATIFSILSLLILFNAFGRLADCYLRSLGKTKQQFYFRIIEFVSKLGSIVICRSFGLYGVVIGLVVAEGLVKVAKLIYASSLIDFPLKRLLTESFSSIRAMLILVSFAIILYLFLPDNLTGEIILLVVLTIVTLILFAFFPKYVGGYYSEKVYSSVVCKLPDRVQRIVKLKTVKKKGELYA